MTAAGRGTGGRVTGGSGSSEAGSGIGASEALHANCLVIGTAGLLVRGRSGSGKSGFSDHLIEAARTRGSYANLVSDDRVHLAAEAGLLIARPPKSISGLLEVRGAGLMRTGYQPVAVITLLVDLEPAETLERLPERAFAPKKVGDVLVPSISCPENRPDTGLRLVRWALRSVLAGTPDYI